MAITITKENLTDVISYLIDTVARKWRKLKLLDLNDKDDNLVVEKYLETLPEEEIPLNLEKN